MKFVDIENDKDLFIWQEEIEKEIEKLIIKQFGDCYRCVGFGHHIKNDFLEFTFTMAID